MPATWLALVLLTACGPGSADGPLPVWEPDSDALFDAPWPTDARRNADGTVDLSGFPNPAGLSLIDRYVAIAEQDGWGTNAPLYLRFEEPLDPALLPDPAASLEPGAPLFLVDVDPTSPRWGERVPVQWEMGTTAQAYRPENLLAVGPLFGFPLRPATTYALVVTTGIAAPHEAFQTALREDPLYAPLKDALFFQGLTADDVAVATVFTTGDPVAEMDVLAHFVQERIDAPPLSQSLSAIDETLFFDLWKGRYEGPLMQHGTRPYATTGGGFAFREDGLPLLAGWDPMRIAVTTPKDLSEVPEDGWPVVIYAHGTGGSYRSVASDASGLGVASQLAKAGMVGIGFDQPLHGTRATDGTDPETHTFNYLNPDSARANFRQGALDILYLARMLTTQDVVFTTPDGEEIPLDASRVLFMGHSQGGITGAIALPWLGEDVRGAMLSGAGGGLAITVVERKDPMDIAAMLSQLLQFDEDEEVSEYHPVVGLLQSLVDVTDPINYAPYWYAEDGAWAVGRPTSVLLTSGLLDAQTPYRTAEALAAAARMPPLRPSATQPVALQIQGLEEQASPLAGNLDGWDGRPVTAALSQWAESDHFVVFDEKAASNMVRDFLRSAADGEPTITLE